MCEKEEVPQAGIGVAEPEKPPTFTESLEKKIKAGCEECMVTERKLDARERAMKFLDKHPLFAEFADLMSQI